MFRGLIAGAAIALASTVALAQQQNFRLVNATGYQIDQVYVASSKSTDWQEDVMGKDALGDGQAVDISFSKGERACSFDLMAVYSDGSKAVWEGLDLCAISEVTLHWDATNQVSRAVVK